MSAFSLDSKQRSVLLYCTDNKGIYKVYLHIPTKVKVSSIEVACRLISVLLENYSSDTTSEDEYPRRSGQATPLRVLVDAGEPFLQ